MKKNFAVCGVKTEFEAEAARIEEVMRLKDIASRADLGITLKIGGCEAITDMFEAQHIGVDGLIAPMIESAYAIRKYLEAIESYFPKDSRKRIVFGVNIETYQGYLNLADILNVPKLHLIQKVTLGRVDMSASLGLSRDEINNEKMFEIAQNLFRQCKKKRLTTTMGGGIAREAIPFIKKLTADKLLDSFETRKIIFTVPKNFKRVEEGIISANQFELLWLENKKNYYERICKEDDKRIKMLKYRIALKKKE